MLHFQNSTPWIKLTLPQMDFWEEFILHPGLPVSTVAHCIDIKGKVDKDALFRAIARTVEEAEILSVRFRQQQHDACPQQCIDRQQAPRIRCINLTSSADPVAEAHRKMDTDIRMPLDLKTDRLSAQWLFHISENRFFWYSRAHHIIIDGYGMNLIEQRCAELYNWFVNQGGPGQPFHPFADFIIEEETYSASCKWQDDRSYWTDYLRQKPFPSVLDRGAETCGAPGHHFRAELSEQIQANLKQLASVTGIALTDILFLISGIYVFHSLPQKNRNMMTLWQPYMNRWGSVGAHIPAMLVNILPFHLEIRGDETLHALLQRADPVLKNHRRHSRYRIEQLAKDHGITGDRRFFFSPLINILHFSSPGFTGCKAERHILAAGPGDGFNLTFRADQHGYPSTVDIDVDATMITAQQFAQHKENFLPFLEKMLSTETLSSPLCVL